MEDKMNTAVIGCGMISDTYLAVTEAVFYFTDRLML